MPPEPAPLRTCPRCRAHYVREDARTCLLDGAPLVESMVDPLIGTSLDRFDLLEFLGAGGMARVYRARHKFLDEEVAIKLVYGDILADKALMARFRREAFVSSKVRDPNVLAVRDFGATPEGLWFMTMDLVRGETLASFLVREGPLSGPRAAQIGIQICRGLAAAHALGFVHRDLKPSNLMFDGENARGADRTLKLVDFGLVRRLQASPETIRLTRSGDIFGTPSYMAPEQILTAAVEPRTDLYALGATLFEMVAGQPPFRGAMAQILLKHLNDLPPRLPAMGGLESVIDRLLAKRPEGRPATAAEVEDLLRAVAQAPATSHGAERTRIDPRPTEPSGFEDTAPSALNTTRNEATIVDTVLPLLVRKHDVSVNETRPMEQAPPRFPVVAETVGYGEPAARWDEVRAEVLDVPAEAPARVGAPVSSWMRYGLIALVAMIGAFLAVWGLTRILR